VAQRVAAKAAFIGDCMRHREERRRPPANDTGLKGVVTERDFAAAEIEFPGITRFYRRCRPRPTTFLDLMWRFSGDMASLVFGPIAQS
jgi:hypothetical protein